MPHSIFAIGALLNQVINLRSVARLRLLDAVLTGRQQLLQLAIGIGNIAEHPSFGRASLDAGRHFAAVDALHAERALLHHTLVLTEKAGIVRARDDAITAAYAIGFVD